MSVPPTAESLLADVRKLVTSPTATRDMLLQAIEIAFQIGKSEGRVEGAENMGRHLIGSVDAQGDKACLVRSS